MLSLRVVGITWRHNSAQQTSKFLTVGYHETAANKSVKAKCYPKTKFTKTHHVLHLSKTCAFYY